MSGCTCYLGDPDDSTREQEACASCDAPFWSDPVFMLVDDDTGDVLGFVERVS